MAPASTHCPAHARTHTAGSLPSALAIFEAPHAYRRPAREKAYARTWTRRHARQHAGMAAAPTSTGDLEDAVLHDGTAPKQLRESFPVCTGERAVDAAVVAHDVCDDLVERRRVLHGEHLMLELQARKHTASSLRSALTETGASHTRHAAAARGRAAARSVETLATAPVREMSVNLFTSRSAAAGNACESPDFPQRRCAPLREMSVNLLTSRSAAAGNVSESTCAPLRDALM